VPGGIPPCEPGSKRSAPAFRSRSSCRASLHRNLRRWRATSRNCSRSVPPRVRAALREIIESLAPEIGDWETAAKSFQARHPQLAALRRRGSSPRSSTGAMWSGRLSWPVARQADSVAKGLAGGSPGRSGWLVLLLGGLIVGGMISELVEFKPRESADFSSPRISFSAAGLHVSAFGTIPYIDNFDNVKKMRQRLSKLAGDSVARRSGRRGAAALAALLPRPRQAARVAGGQEMSSDAPLPGELSQWAGRPVRAAGTLLVGRREKRAKRAYLKLARHYKPEHEPEKFQRLRRAFEQVQQQIEFRQRTRASGTRRQVSGRLTRRPPPDQERSPSD